MSVLDRLRDETRDLHQGLERDLDWERRMSTIEAYGRLLARWWGFHATFEPMIAARPPFAGLEGREKLRFVEGDLLHLGFLPAAVAALPRIGPLTFLGDRAALIGAMYVLEGSTLGGQVIARHIERVLGAGVAAGGCAYFRGYGKSATLPMWHTFQTRLSEEVDASMHDDVVEGARRTFAALQVWLPG